MAGVDVRRILFRSHCDATDCTRFACGEDEIDKWFRNKSKNDHRNLKHVVTCAYLEGDDDRVVGFYALATIVEEAARLERQRYNPSYGSTRHFPCLNLVYIAVAKDFQNDGIGTALLGRVVADFVEIGSRIGLPLLMLMPINPRVAAFYERHGFGRYRSGGGMYLPLESALEA